MASERLASNSKKSTGRTRRRSNVKGTQKSAGAFRTISEVSAALDVPQHVLRFWETKFSQVRPMKRAGGRRYYRPEDVRLLFGIREFLYEDGYTIRGVQKLLRERGGRILAERADGKGLVPVAGGDVQVSLKNKKRTQFSLPEESQRRELSNLLHELEELSGILKKQLGGL